MTPQSLRRSLDIAVGELAAVGEPARVGARHFNDDDADLGIAGCDGRGCKIGGRDIVIVPQIQVDGLSAGNSRQTCGANMPKCVRPSAAVSGPE